MIVLVAFNLTDADRPSLLKEARASSVLKRSEKLHIGDA